MAEFWIENTVVIMVKKQTFEVANKTLSPRPTAVANSQRRQRWYEYLSELRGVQQNDDDRHSVISVSKAPLLSTPLWTNKASPDPTNTRTVAGCRLSTWSCDWAHTLTGRTLWLHGYTLSAWLFEGDCWSAWNSGDIVATFVRKQGQLSSVHERWFVSVELHKCSFALKIASA